MRKLIYKTIIFLLPVLLLPVCFELLYQTAPNNYTSKNESIKKRYNDTQVLIFGNSHTFYGLNPKCFDKRTFNLSNISQTLYFDQLLFNKHITKFKKLQYVILNIDYSSLSQVDNSDEDVWRKYYYEKYMDLKVPIISVLDPKAYFLSSTRSFVGNMELAKRYFFEKTIVDCDENGFGINYTKEKRQLNFNETVLAVIKKHEDNLLDFSKNVSRVQTIINKCKQKKIKVILVTIPSSKAYCEGVNQLKWKKIEDACYSIENKNENVHYLNLFKDSRFNDDDFYDLDHLHTEGANKCSVIVNNFLRQL